MKSRIRIILALLATTFNSSMAQTTPTANFIGRWEVLQYAEQGLQVDKKNQPFPKPMRCTEFKLP